MKNAAENIEQESAGDSDRPPDKSLANVIISAARLISSEFHRRYDALGYDDISPGSGYVFELIKPEGSTITAMAKQASMTPQAMVQFVDYLEARGYVERTPDPADRRAKLVRLTSRGETAVTAGFSALNEMELEWGQLVGADTLSDLRKTLNRLIDASVAHGD